jgi:PAS domain S-box-containing protein
LGVLVVAEISILVVDEDAEGRQLLQQTLLEAGLIPILTRGGAHALEWLETHTPSVVLVDLALPAPNGCTLIERMRQNPKFSDMPIVALTALASDLDLSRLFASGADDYVHKPFRPAELLARIRGQLRVREYLDRLNQRERDQETVLELTQTLASTLDIRDILFTVVERVAAFARVDRCSVVLFGDSGTVGYVLATSDDEQIRDLPIDLAKYPEIRQVLLTGRALVIRDATAHPLLCAVRQTEPKIGFNSFALLPILHDHGAMGVLFLRSKGIAAFDEHDLSLISTLTNAMAIALRNARILQSLRDATEKSRSARAEAERRVQFFQRYADFFESAADGMVVINGEGKLLFANPRAREISGFSETELVALRFEDFLAPVERSRAARLLRGFLDGIYPRGVDIQITSKSGDERTISVSFSSVLHEDHAVVFSFRDVTKERGTAIELQQTKEFLESVIDSSVDGIVSANLRGTVLLFNRAAARIFGYAPSEVVGKMHVGTLYPAGGAHEIMRKIRDPNVSGYGRLEDHRVDMLHASGEPIQVLLSASLVIDNGRPIGSVGIFTDIREKLRMEARLSMAQDALRSREKQAIVAELAGAAAHELNQPLTSVIGYAELLRRQLEDHPQLSHAASVIVSEAERMAEIVRKVGKITKYETKNYVGAARILDLERATENEGEDLPQ